MEGFLLLQGDELDGERCDARHDGSDGELEAACVGVHETRWDEAGKVAKLAV